MNKELLPVPKETPSTLSELRDKLVNLEGKVSINHGKIFTLKNTIYNGGAKIEEVGNIFGLEGVSPSTRSVKAALTQINSDFTSSFKNTATVIGHINDNLFNTLEIIKFMIICMGQITYNQRKDKKASEKAVKRLKEVVEKVETGELNISELIDIFAENVKAEAKEYQLLEEKISNLSDKQADFISRSKEQTSNALIEIEKQAEELSSSLREDQKTAIASLKRAIEENIAQINEKSENLTKSQDEFIAKSKELSSNALSLLKDEADAKVTIMKEEMERFMKDHEAQVFEMKKQVKTYKIISIIAIAGSIASVICSLLF